MNQWECVATGRLSGCVYGRVRNGSTGERSYRQGFGRGGRGLRRRRDGGTCDTASVVVAIEKVGGGCIRSADMEPLRRSCGYSVRRGLAWGGGGVGRGCRPTRAVSAFHGFLDSATRLS